MCRVLLETPTALSPAAYQDSTSLANKDSYEIPSRRMAPAAIYQPARNLIPLEHGHFELGHINDVLLLAPIKTAQPDLMAAGILMGFASRIALKLSICEDPGAHRGQSSTHTYMCWLLLDSLLSARLELQPNLRPLLTQRMTHHVENDLDEWQHAQVLVLTQQMTACDEDKYSAQLQDVLRAARLTAACVVSSFLASPGLCRCPQCTSFASYFSH
ncbi:hypothetical protein F4778DRAFT_714280 [Xylariomycetidae sp. FL2044]|nr:hypothetical protein F4778DRAFT_714280 [Xylariomycetidae sp. FL2044]